MKIVNKPVRNHLNPKSSFYTKNYTINPQTCGYVACQKSQEQVSESREDYICQIDKNYRYYSVR